MQSLERALEARGVVAAPLVADVEIERDPRSAAEAQRDRADDDEGNLLGAEGVRECPSRLRLASALDERGRQG
jgi:hypothetical protein